MAAVPELNNISVWENDNTNELLCVWVYPKLSVEWKDFISTRCQLLLDEDASSEYIYGQHSNQWYYIRKYAGSKEKEVKDVLIAICTKSFNPELYMAFGDVCYESYQNSTSAILSHYLTLFTKGVCVRSSNSKLLLADYDKKKAYLASSIKGVVGLFGMESILIYAGLLLKKRLVLYSPRVESLIKVCRALPCFVYHRQNWDIVFPFLQLKEEELNELKSKRTYIAGFTDPAVENRTDIYDLFLNVTDGEITINPDSRDNFQLGKMHKEIAKFMVQEAQSEQSNDYDLIKGLTQKTLDIISNLKSLDAGSPEDPTISMELLQTRNLSNAMQTFLYNLASAEGFVKL